MPPTLTALETFLAGVLSTARFPTTDPAGIWRPGVDPTQPIARLGLALEPWPGLTTWAERERLDALWLHRPWRLADLSPPLPAPLGILAHHLAFDEHLTTGLNPRLADALGFADPPEPFGEKDGRPLGMTGRLADEALPCGDFAKRASEVFGGLDQVTPPPANAENLGGPLVVAVVGAMNDSLIRAAANRGVRAYVTGQWRQPAAKAVRETGTGVLVVGHARTERWGVGALADLLRERWAGLEVEIAPGSSPRRDLSADYADYAD